MVSRKAALGILNANLISMKPQNIPRPRQTPWTRLPIDLHRGERRLQKYRGTIVAR
jgi:hypothetical protein